MPSTPLRFAIVEEVCTSGILRYVYLHRGSPHMPMTLSMTGLLPEYRGKPPSDMTYAERNEAEADAAILRKLQPTEHRCSYWVAMLDEPCIEAMRTLAAARRSREPTNKQ